MKHRIVTSALTSIIMTMPIMPSAAAETASSKITGTYHLVTTETCVRTPYEVPPATGFDVDTRALLEAGEAVSAIGEAQARFNADGTVQLTAGKQTETSLASVQLGDTPIVPPSLFSCDGHYTLNGKKVGLTLDCDVAHPDPNIGIRLGSLTFAGQIGQNGKIISLTNLDRAIQTVTVSFRGNPIQQRQRICSQTALFTK